MLVSFGSFTKNWLEKKIDAVQTKKKSQRMKLQGSDQLAYFKIIQCNYTIKLKSINQ